MKCLCLYEECILYLHHAEHVRLTVTIGLPVSYQTSYGLNLKKKMF